MGLLPALLLQLQEKISQPVTEHAAQSFLRGVLSFQVGASEALGASAAVGTRAVTLQIIGHYRALGFRTQGCGFRAGSPDA